jgi:hypothetical protein
MANAPHPLAQFISESGDDPAEFAARMGADIGEIASLLAGARTTNLALARRIVAACGGAVELAALLPEAGDVVDLGAAADDDLDPELMAAVIDHVVGGWESWDNRQDAQPLAALAAEAAIATYAALGAVSSGGRPRRLALALAPVVQRIREEQGATPAPDEIDRSAAFAARLYFEAAGRRR